MQPWPYEWHFLVYLSELILCKTFEASVHFSCDKNYNEIRKEVKDRIELNKALLDGLGNNGGSISTCINNIHYFLNKNIMCILSVSFDITESHPHLYKCAQ